MKTFFKKVWDAVNGNKTIIGLALLQAVEYVPIPEPWKQIVVVTISILTGASAGHHIQKQIKQGFLNYK
jgi:hypothetical protein